MCRVTQKASSSNHTKCEVILNDEHKEANITPSKSVKSIPITRSIPPPINIKDKTIKNKEPRSFGTSYFSRSRINKNNSESDNGKSRWSSNSHVSWLSGKHFRSKSSKRSESNNSEKNETYSFKDNIFKSHHKELTYQNISYRDATDVNRSLENNSHDKQTNQNTYDSPLVDIYKGYCIDSNLIYDNKNSVSTSKENNQNICTFDVNNINNESRSEKSTLMSVPLIIGSKENKIHSYDSIYYMTKSKSFTLSDEKNVKNKIMLPKNTPQRNTAQKNTPQRNIAQKKKSSFRNKYFDHKDNLVEKVCSSPESCKSLILGSSSSYLSKSSESRIELITNNICLDVKKGSININAISTNDDIENKSITLVESNQFHNNIYEKKSSLEYDIPNDYSLKKSSENIENSSNIKSNKTFNNYKNNETFNIERLKNQNIEQSNRSLEFNCINQYDVIDTTVQNLQSNLSQGSNYILESNMSIESSYTTKSNMSRESSYTTESNMSIESSYKSESNKSLDSKCSSESNMGSESSYISESNKSLDSKCSSESNMSQDSSNSSESIMSYDSNYISESNISHKSNESDNFEICKESDITYKSNTLNKSNILYKTVDNSIYNKKLLRQLQRSNEHSYPNNLENLKITNNLINRKSKKKNSPIGFNKNLRVKNQKYDLNKSNSLNEKSKSNRLKNLNMYENSSNMYSSKMPCRFNSSDNKIVNISEQQNLSITNNNYETSSNSILPTSEVSILNNSYSKSCIKRTSSFDSSILSLSKSKNRFVSQQNRKKRSSSIPLVSTNHNQKSEMINNYKQYKQNNKISQEKCSISSSNKNILESNNLTNSKNQETTKSFSFSTSIKKNSNVQNDTKNYKQIQKKLTFRNLTESTIEDINDIVNISTEQNDKNEIISQVKQNILFNTPRQSKLKEKSTVDALNTPLNSIISTLKISKPISNPLSVVKDMAGGFARICLQSQWGEAACAALAIQGSIENKRFKKLPEKMKDNLHLIVDSSKKNQFFETETNSINSTNHEKRNYPISNIIENISNDVNLRSIEEMNLLNNKNKQNCNDNNINIAKDNTYFDEFNKNSKDFNEFNKNSKDFNESNISHIETISYISSNHQLYSDSNSKSSEYCKIDNFENNQRDMIIFNHIENVSSKNYQSNTYFSERSLQYTISPNTKSELNFGFMSGQLDEHSDTSINISPTTGISQISNLSLENNISLLSDIQTIANTEKSRETWKSSEVNKSCISKHNSSLWNSDIPIDYDETANPKQLQPTLSETCYYNNNVELSRSRSLNFNNNTDYITHGLSESLSLSAVLHLRDTKSNKTNSKYLDNYRDSKKCLPSDKDNLYNTCMPGIQNYKYIHTTLNITNTSSCPSSSSEFIKNYTLDEKSSSKPSFFKNKVAFPLIRYSSFDKDINDIKDINLEDNILFKTELSQENKSTKYNFNIKPEKDMFQENNLNSILEVNKIKHSYTDENGFSNDKFNESNEKSFFKEPLKNNTHSQKNTQSNTLNEKKSFSFKNNLVDSNSFISKRNMISKESENNLEISNNFDINNIPIIKNFSSNKGSYNKIKIFKNTTSRENETMEKVKPAFYTSRNHCRDSSNSLSTFKRSQYLKNIDYKALKNNDYKALKNNDYKALQVPNSCFNESNIKKNYKSKDELQNIRNESLYSTELSLKTSPKYLNANISHLYNSDEYNSTKHKLESNLFDNDPTFETHYLNIFKTTKENNIIDDKRKNSDNIYPSNYIVNLKNKENRNSVIESRYPTPIPLENPFKFKQKRSTSKNPKFISRPYISNNSKPLSSDTSLSKNNDLNNLNNLNNSDYNEQRYDISSRYCKNNLINFSFEKSKITSKPINLNETFFASKNELDYDSDIYVKNKSINKNSDSAATKHKEGIFKIHFPLLQSLPTSGSVLFNAKVNILCDLPSNKFSIEYPTLLGFGLYDPTVIQISWEGVLKAASFWHLARKSAPALLSVPGPISIALMAFYENLIQYSVIQVEHSGDLHYVSGRRLELAKIILNQAKQYIPITLEQRNEMEYHEVKDLIDSDCEQLDVSELYIIINIPY